MPKRAKSWLPKELRKTLVCKSCKLELPREQFQERGRAKSGLLRYDSRCRECSNIHANANWKSRVGGRRRYKNVEEKKKLVDAIKKACVVCGYDTCKAALDLHHKDPGIKDADISDMIYRRGTKLKQVVEELEKCVVVCCRCHRELHAGMIEL